MIKVGDGVKIPEQYGLATDWESDFIMLKGLYKDDIKHGYTMLTGEYYKKGAMVLDIKKGYNLALLKVPTRCDYIILPWSIEKLKIFKISLKNIMEEIKS